MKIALVHDYLNQYGGAERVLECFMDMFPDSPVFTVISDLNKMPQRFKEADIRSSFIQNIPFSKNQYKKMLTLFPIAVEQMDLRGYDLVLSSSSAFAKGIITRADQIHVCYCHTPMRYIWDLYHQYMDEISNPVFRTVLPYMLHKIRIWDQMNAQRVDRFISNSHNVARRIQKYYNRESQVIHPPVSFSHLREASSSEDFFLIVSRLIPYKRIDLVIEAFNKLNRPLVIIGDGYDRNRLMKMAGPHIQMLGYQSDAVIQEYYAKCKAFILAGEEDFGITPLEAQAHGKPVIAFGKGGALETVVEGKTGLFFREQTIESLIEAITKLEMLIINSKQIHMHAMSFNEDRFKVEIRNFINTTIREKDFVHV
ncbi:glycosyltransferase [Paenibacillus cremeus]|uniref:Glycosyltransferase family 4 protein n=1 Tax=Paenibacillus cremeus TaxID=2163881 RepID=A0A559KCE4_9BACL|nr:glycosyltransferase [Paenibacillus cremeus]TVY09791.1 glycosyltransferase family 4 protein [Paenibacillus cremeus]